LSSNFKNIVAHLAAKVKATNLDYFSTLYTTKVVQEFRVQPPQKELVFGIDGGVGLKSEVYTHRAGNIRSGFQQSWGP